MISRIKQSGRAAPGAKGFTLIEIILVLLLMSLIVGIAAVMMANVLPRARMAAAAAELAAAMKYARNLAWATQQTQTVAIDLQARTYSLNGRGPKVLAGDAAITIYERPETPPVRDGKYTIVYRAAYGSNWSSMTLIRRGKIVTIKADPVLAAFVVQGNANENAIR